MKSRLAEETFAGDQAASLLHALLDDTEEIVFVADARLRTLLVNASMARAVDRTAALLVGQDVERTGLFGQAAPALCEAMKRALVMRSALRFDIEWLRDGASATYDVRIGLDSRRPAAPRLIVRARDVTAQRELERAMHLPESAFRTLAENSPDMIVRYGPDGRAVYCNREIARRRQVDRQALIGRRRGETLPTDEATKRAYARIVDRALQTGEGGSIEVTAPNLQGELRVNNIVVVAERDDTGAICGALAVARDVTDLVRMREALVARERDFRTLAENSPDNIIRYGLDGRAVYCNREIEERVNVTVSRIVGRTPLESAPPGIEGVEAYQEQLLRTLATGDGGTVELRVPHPSGEMRIHSVVFAAEHDPSGAICGAVAVGRDVTGFVRMQQSLASKEHKFRTLAENAGDHIARFDADTRLLYVNPAMTRLLGRPGEEVVGLTPSEAMRTTGSTMWPVEEAIRRVARSGSEEVIELRFTPPGTQREAVHQIRLFPERDENGVVTSVLGIGRDISEKIAQLEVIESLLHTDPLTQLANRRALQQRAPALFAAAERHHNRVGVLVLDLDQFKAINDGIGHSAGDQLLCEVAHRLVRALRANDLLVRLGGDEFVVIAPDMDHAELVGVVSNRLHHALAAPLSLGTRDVRMTASIGVAVYPQDGTGLEELLANADAAMYVAKRGGRARTEYYRAELGEAVRRRLLLEQTLRHACDGPGLELHYQPQVSLHDPSRILGAEALLRWHHPTLGLLTPDAFIALAEETDLIRPIGRWVLRSAAEAVVRWNRGRNHPLHVSVNVSTRQFSDDGLPAYVDEVLAQTGCSPRWLWIEITESALLQDSARVQKTLEALRARGVRVAIDDFGTGYSALNYLGRFPIDCLKIDRSFVHAIGRSARDDELVKAFIAMATALNLSMVAEGVETAEQHAFLLAQGCVLAQGWRFGVPVPDARFLPR